MKSKHSEIEAITIRRATLADTDKVRYRVYSSPTEFIAVIAESALMAVKVSGIRKPHKIVRDLPTEGVAIEAKKMAAVDHAAARIALPVKQLEKSEKLIAPVKEMDPNARQALFKPMTIGDLRSKGQVRARILPPELLNEILEQHAKAATPPIAPPAAPEPGAVMPEPFTPPAPAPVVPELSPQERILEMTKDLPKAEPEAERELTPEEVEALLNS